jgi:hypothetical protein
MGDYRDDTTTNPYPMGDYSDTIIAILYSMGDYGYAGTT